MATNIKYGFVNEAADAGGVGVKALLGTPGISGTLAARVAAADADGSGVLSLAELVSVFRSEEDAVKDKKIMRRCAAPRRPADALAAPPMPLYSRHALAVPLEAHSPPRLPPSCRDPSTADARRIAIAASVLVVVLCAAMTGLTYAVVSLSKDSRVGDNGVMVVKGSDTPVSTGGAAAASGS
jgi:hypothetical protein